jgi:hypothetical protein
MRRNDWSPSPECALTGSGQTFLARRERIAARLAGVTAPAVPRFEPGPRWERVVTASCTRRADDPPRPLLKLLPRAEYPLTD